MVIAESLREFNPDLDIAMLVVPEKVELDEVDSFSPGDLNLSDLRAREFGYGETALTYALTAAFIRLLLVSGYAQSLLFIKQESMVIGDLAPIFDELETGEILLTPHLLEPVSDGYARELNILQSGVYNGGVLGVTWGEESLRFLDWWDARLATRCRHNVVGGMHFEQRWLDLVPGLFGSVRISRNPGHNIGHWCLPERSISVEGGQVLANGYPGRIFRFSGFDLDDPRYPTIHSDRIATDSLGDAAIIFERYRSAARLARSRLENSNWAPRTPSQTEFTNGVPIPRAARDLYLEAAPVHNFGDPFDSEKQGSFFEWLTRPVDQGAPTITNLWHHIHQLRPDLRYAFRDHLGTDREAFASWVVEAGLGEHGIDPALAPK